jgi:hypothetical protein
MAFVCLHTIGQCRMKIPLSIVIVQMKIGEAGTLPLYPIRN